MSLIHYWPLDEETGVLAEDQISGTFADIEGDPTEATAVSSKFAFGRNFALADGGKARAHLWTGAENLTASYANWTISLWFRKDGTGFMDGEQIQPIIAFGDESIADRSAVRVATTASGGTLYLHLKNDDNTVINEWGLQVYENWIDEQWHLITIVCDGTDTRFYLDGTLQATEPAAVPLMPEVAQSYLGGNQPAYSPTGQSAVDYTELHFDDIAVFDNALTATEVSDIWNGGTGTVIAPAAPPESDPFIPPEAPTRIYYAAELRKSGSDPLRLPISSWQATLQTGRQSYLQCVVPAAEQYIDDITAMGLTSTLTVIRGALLPDGETTELDMATVPLEQMPYQRGATRSTVTLSGYGTIEFDVVDTETPPAGSIRTLEGVQTLSVDNSGTRARSQIDWLLRPGLIADADGSQFQVAFINYYVNNAQEFMDCGSRAL